MKSAVKERRNRGNRKDGERRQNKIKFKKVPKKVQSHVHFHQDLSSTKSKTVSILSDLKTHSWLDRATRALFIDLTVYNANVNLFCQIRLIAEFTPTGGILTSAEFNTVDLITLKFTPIGKVNKQKGFSKTFTSSHFI